MAAAERSKILLLFDVDGTLTKPRNVAEPWMLELLQKAKEKVYIGIVGGSDYDKQQEQLEGIDLKGFFDYVFSENGLVAFHNGEKINDHSLKNEFNEEEIKQFVNFCLHYIADLDIPIKRGTFVEFRTGMINISPIGRNCSQSEREAYYALDQEQRIRPKMIEAITNALPDIASRMKMSIGGQISFDCFPVGWDKTYCLRFVENFGFEKIYFFGDKTYEGGNDWEIFNDPRTEGKAVDSPNKTREFVEEILAGLQ